MTFSMIICIFILYFRFKIFGLFLRNRLFILYYFFGIFTYIFFTNIILFSEDKIKCYDHINNKVIINYTSENLQDIKESNYQIKVFCAIVTKPSNFNQSIAIRNSWAKRCDGHLFFSSENNSFLPSINIKIKEGREQLWLKTKRLFRYIYDNELNKYEFFLKIDDDSFVVVENLKEFLATLNYQKPIYTGHRFKLENQQSYMSGGAGYVLSQAGVKVLVESGIGRHRACVHGMEESEDINLGKCLQGLNVEFVDSRDNFGLERFHPLSFKTMINSKIFNITTWIPKFNYYPLKYDFNCCSKKSITFHYLSQEDINDLEYLLYYLVK